MNFRITGKSNKICVIDRLMVLLSTSSSQFGRNAMELLTGIFEISTAIFYRN
jgi:hypothetical protein